MTEKNVICIKWGTAFGPEYVNRLYRGVRRHISGDLRFLCVTDDRAGIRPEVEIVPLISEPFHASMMEALAQAPRQCPIQKITLRRPDLVTDLRGPLLSLDIDVVVTGGLDDLMEYAPHKVAMRRVWSRPSRRIGLANSSAVRFDPTLHHYLYETMARDPWVEVMKAHGSEQSYVSWTAKEHGDLALFPDQWCASFKYNCRPTRPLNLFLAPRLPPDARLVFFHGRPKMEEAVSGYRAGPLHSTRPASWLTEAWRDDP
ncbi:glycosyl transferase [Yoonia sp.]|uniref:glycosyl transferase n=1 Tax=Yoonia sp. TaxID=2212373 RepID=UPI002FDA9971